MRGDGRIYQRGTIWWVQYSHRDIGAMNALFAEG
jgi:hypothetical protein